MASNTPPLARTTENLVQEHAETGLNTSDLLRLDQLSGLGTYFSGIRLAAFSTLMSEKFPTSSSELWRQTRPDQFPFETLRHAASVKFDLQPFSQPAAQRSDLVVIKQGEKGAEQSLLEEVLGERSSDVERNAVSALQLACASALCTVRIKKGAEVPEPLLLSQLLVNGPPPAAGSMQSAAPLITIVLEAGARCTLIEDLSFNSVFYAPRLEFLLEKNSDLTFVSLQQMDIQSCYLARQRFHIGRAARLRTFHAALGAGVARIDLDCRFYQPEGQADLCAIYLTDQSRQADFHPIQEHLAPECRSELFCRGVLKDSSRGVYYGVIKVAEGADKTDAFQRNKNLLLSNDARVDTVPNLEIRANDVKCSHGAAVGQVGADELFYLMTRGLPAAEAERLLLEGFFEDLLIRIVSEPVRDWMRGKLLASLRKG